MTETNVRIVQPGIDLFLITRCAKIIANNLTAEIIEKVCNRFVSQGLAAVYCRERKQILVITQGTISPFEVKEDNWIVKVEDNGKTQKIQFSHSENDARLLAQLIERHVRIKVKQRLKMHTFDSPRIFQETKPFRTEEGIDVYSRFEVSAFPIQDVGVGISVDISTAFFTHKTIAEIFRDDIPDHEQERQQDNFESLSQRQKGQKGTLLYNLEYTQRKCYFCEFLHGVTCATTAPLYVNGQTYGSLFEYYQHKHPHLKINPDDSVAMVSFKGIDQPRPVAAKLLRLRIVNETLPSTLKQEDKISPKERCDLIADFWDRLGIDLLGYGKPPIAKRFWCPGGKHKIYLSPPSLQFADEITLQTPQKRSYTDFQEHYRQRSRLLNKYGCLDTPISMTRSVNFAIPTKLTQEIRGSLIKDLTDNISRLTRKPIAPVIVVYKTLDEAFLKLNKSNKPGVVVFVFDNVTPENYYEVAYKLSNWRVKRITLRELERQFNRIKSTINTRNGKFSKTENGWRSFIEMNALDVLQQMDCIPWGLKDAPPYDAHLAIDVGRDRRYFALSLITFDPSICIYTVAKVKYDAKKETINGVVLEEEIMELCNRVSQRGDFQTLRSLLVLRDGRDCDGELDAIYTANEKLIKQKFFAEDVKVDVVDFHKSISKNIRTWERTRENEVLQILEGKAVIIDRNTVVLNTTGAPSRYQGTSDPVMLVGRSENINMNQVTKAVYISTHLNYSNPNVAQRLPLELKRTDDELRNRAAQEIRGLK